MDSESCELGNSGKRNWSDSYCSSLPPAKRFNKNAILCPEDLKEEDDFGCISDLIQVTGDCDFSDGNLRSYDGSPPDSTQMDLDDLLTSLLTDSEIPNSFSEPETINRLNGDSREIGGSASNLYSGPTIMDVQSALSLYQRKEQSLSTTSISTSSTIFESLQSSMSSPFSNFINDLFHTRLHRCKSETKYSLKVKSSENNMDDGYKWRKYGQKVIKNSPYPRSYYRCTNPKCRAKKQVEKCVEDPHTLTISYEGLHLHYSYSPLQITQQPNYILHNNICGKEKTKKAAGSDNGYINGCFKIEGHGDLMLSSESPTHQLLLEENDNCCTQLLQDDKCYESHTILLPADQNLLEGSDKCYESQTILPAHQILLEESDKCYESHTILPAHQNLLEESDKCCESLRFWRENSGIIDGTEDLNVGVVEEGGRGGQLEDIVPLQVINPSSSSSSSTSFSSP